MTPDEQEARSTVQVRGLLLVSLRSGAFAVFARDFSTLLAIEADLAVLTDSLRTWADQAELRWQGRAGQGSGGVVGRLEGKTLEELGL